MGNGWFRVSNDDERVTEMCEHVENYARESNIKLLCGLLEKKAITLEIAAEQLGVSVSEFLGLVEKYGSKKNAD